MDHDLNLNDKSFVFIEFEYNGREIFGIEEFRYDLVRHYHLVQGRSRFIPAASEGGELWLTIFLNLPIAEFILGNLAWDLFKVGAKKMFLRPLIEALDNLEKANESATGLRVKRLKLQFDDTYIYIGGINSNFLSIVGTVFNKLSQLVEKFKEQTGLPLTSIELPLEYNESIDKPGYSKYTIDTFHDSTDSAYYVRQWKLVYLNGQDCKVYDFYEDRFLEC